MILNLMVHCNQCRKHIPGNWNIKKKQNELQLGIGQIWLLSKHSGCALAYCKECFDAAMKGQNTFIEKSNFQDYENRSQTRDIHRSVFNCSQLQYSNVRRLEEDLEERSQTIYELKMEVRRYTEQIDDLKNKLKRGGNYQEAERRRKREERYAARQQQLEREMHQLKQEVFNSECERNKLEVELGQVNATIERKRLLNSASDGFERIYEVFSKIPACVERTLADRHQKVKDLELQLAEQIRALTQQLVRSHREEVTALIESMKATKENQLRILEQIRDDFRRNAQQSGLYSADEIDEGLRPTERKIARKLEQLKEFEVVDEPNFSERSVIEYYERQDNLDDWVC